MEKLHKSLYVLQCINESLVSRPFSSRIHGQFDHEYHRSQATITLLTQLLRNTRPKTEQERKDHIALITVLRDLTLQIEKEWRIASGIITKQRNENQTRQHRRTNTDTVKKSLYQNKSQRHHSKTYPYDYESLDSVDSKTGEFGTSQVQNGTSC